MLKSFSHLINDVSNNIEEFQFNKSVAKIYEYVNLLTDSVNQELVSKKDFKWLLNKLSLILQPFLPHISEELWQSLENSDLCINQQWPVEKVIEKNTKVNIAIQINGKTRRVIEVKKDLEKNAVLEIIKKDKKMDKYIKDKKIVKEIYVSNKIVNFVM